MVQVAFHQSLGDPSLSPIASLAQLTRVRGRCDARADVLSGRLVGPTCGGAEHFSVPGTDAQFGLDMGRGDGVGKGLGLAGHGGCRC